MVNTAERKITAQKFLRFSDENGKLPVSEINCGIEAHDGKLWFAATGGVLKCSYDEKTGDLEYELFDTSKGLNRTTIPAPLEEDEHTAISGLVQRKESPVSTPRPTISARSR